MQLQLERALALVHAALAEPTEHRTIVARQAARDATAAIEAARRDSRTLSEGHDLVEGLERLRCLLPLLDRRFDLERAV
jgi:hypothetical protein